MNESITYKLGDIARFVNGRAYLMPEMLSQGKYRIVRVGNFTGKDEWYYSDMELEPDKYCESGDLLYKWACTFGPEIWTEEKAIYHYHIWKVIPDERYIDKDYLFYLLGHMTAQWIKAVHGSTMVHITKEMMEQNVVTIPASIQRQRAIVRVLRTIDSKINNNSDATIILEQQAKLLYDYWFVQFDFPDENGKPYKSSGGKMVWNEELKREIPEGWEVTTIGDITICHDSERIPVANKDREAMKGNIPYYGATGIMGYVNKAIFSGNFVLLAEDGSVMDDKGHPIIQRVSGNAWINNHAHVLEPAKGYSCKLLMMVLKDIPVVQIKTGSIQMKINQENLNRYKVVSIPEYLLKATNKKLDLIDEKLLSLERENQQLASLRDFLLPMLMNGQVKVGMHED